MPELTTAVLRQALDQVVTWRAHDRLLRVAVNLSASSLVDAELPSQVFEMLHERQLPPDVLELEITEDSLLGDRERARGVLAELRLLGVRVAVDDFGTGYSSLAYLRELPIDELKLDRSFVSAMAADPRSAAIVRSTIELAHALGLRLVAEGVEDGPTADELARFGCDEAQGFYFSRPLPADELADWLDAQAGVPAQAAHACVRAGRSDGARRRRRTRPAVGRGRARQGSTRGRRRRSRVVRAPSAVRR